MYEKQCDLGETAAVILRHMDRIEDEETLRLVGSVLNTHKKGSLQDFAPFLHHHDPNMRQSAVYATHNCSDKKKHWKVVAAMLEQGGEEAMYGCSRNWDRLVLTGACRLVTGRPGPGIGPTRVSAGNSLTA